VRYEHFILRSEKSVFACYVVSLVCREYLHMGMKKYALFSLHHELFLLRFEDASKRLGRFTIEVLPLLQRYRYLTKRFYAGDYWAIETQTVIDQII
jgi:hypothetical protein